MWNHQFDWKRNRDQTSNQKKLIIKILLQARWFFNFLCSLLALHRRFECLWSFNGVLTLVSQSFFSDWRSFNLQNTLLCVEWILRSFEFFGFLKGPASVTTVTSCTDPQVLKRFLHEPTTAGQRPAFPSLWVFMQHKILRVCSLPFFTCFFHAQLWMDSTTTTNWFAKICG